MKGIFTTLLCLICCIALSSDIDSLIVKKNNCQHTTSCISLLAEICTEAAMQRDVKLLTKYTSEYEIFLDSVEDKRKKIEGYKILGAAYELIYNYSYADSLYRKALIHEKNLNQKVLLQLDIANTLKRRGDTDKSIDVINQVLSGELPDNDPILLAELYIQRGYAHLEIRETASAIDDFTKAKALASDHKNSVVYKNANLELNEMYTRSKSLEKVLHLYQEKLQLAELETDYVATLVTHANILQTLNILGQYNEVIGSGHQALALKKRHNILSGAGTIYAQMAQAFYYLNKKDSALVYCNQGIKLSLNTNEKKDFADNLYIKALILVSQSKYDEAKVIVEKIFELRPYEDLEAQELYAEILIQLGSVKEGFESLAYLWTKRLDEFSIEEVYKTLSLLMDERFEAEQEQKQQAFYHKLQLHNFRNKLFALGLAVLLIGVCLHVQSTDSNKLNEMYELLDKRNVALKKFSNITSSDLNKPIQNILKSTEQVIQTNPRTPRQLKEYKYVEYIKECTKNLLAVTEELKVFSEISLTKAPLEKVCFDEVVQIVTQNLNARLKNSSGKIVYRNENKIKYVEFPKSLLILVVQNLVQNGLKHNDSEHPLVSVFLRKTNRRIIIEIKDNGKGIAAEHHEHIFKPFKTIGKTETSKSSGLGLSICKNILENYQQELWLESDGHSGSSFYFSL